MLKIILTSILLSQYPTPEPQPDCTIDPAVAMVFRWAVECPTHVLKFEFREDGAFRVVCIPARKLRLTK